MRIGVIGLGYVGLTTALGLAKLNHTVYGYEIDEKKRELLSNAELPILEEGMQEVLEESLEKTFFPVTSELGVLESTDVVFICVPTPARKDGNIDLSYVFSVAKSIGENFSKIKNRPVIIVKSTVIPGTTKRVGEIVSELSGIPLDEIKLAMIPEFLRQGRAYYDFMHPDRVVLGVKKDDSQTEKLLLDMFETIDAKKLVVDIETAEFSKYASNSYLALKISFANELANIVDRFNLEKSNREVNVDKIVEIMGMDKRINPSYLGAGPGFGGSCLPKDVKALNAFSKSVGTNFRLLDTITEVNINQPKLVVNHAKRLLGNLENKRIGIIGLAFSTLTNETKDAPALTIVDELKKEKSIIYAWDPKAEESMKKVHPDLIYHDLITEFEDDNLDLAILVTDWKEAKDYLKIKEPLPYKLIDTRRIGIHAEVIIGNSKQS